MVFVNISSLCSVIATIDEAQHEGSMQNDSSVTEVLEMNQEVATTKKKKRVRRSQSCKIILQS
jgi:trimethylguanosine synthase